MKYHHKILNVNFVLTFLFSLTFVISHGQKKNYLELYFNIKYSNGDPVDLAGFRFETDNVRENRIKGSKKEFKSVWLKKGESKAIIQLLYSKFENRSVTITISGSDIRHDKFYVMKNVTIHDGQAFDILLEKDWDAVNAEKKQYLMQLDEISKLNWDTIINAQNYKKMFSHPFILKTDVKNITNNRYSVLFSIDTNCSIINRLVIWPTDGIRPKIIDDFLNQTEKYIKEKRTSCEKADSIPVQINVTTW